jgi:uncharacterized protein YbbC (DUF1343 family)/N-acetylmuramic acid 6-phosphate (MurNAc-6-P) etherase
MKSRKTFFSLFLLLASLLIPGKLQSNDKQAAQPISEQKTSLLNLLRLTPSPESIDYVRNKTQFQLHTLLTEQRHPKTWNLSSKIQQDFEEGLGQLFSVDEDIKEKLETLAKEKEPLEQAAQALEEAILSNKKIYIYGCGATGRLAKQMESAFWRPFWRKARTEKKIWSKVKLKLGDAIEDRLIGEMTGGDRALISSLEGFEDLQLIGRLQLEERRIERGDVVICVTEGGETSSVIGTILAALDEWKKANAYHPEESRKKLYFIYNNPDERLVPFERSRRVIEEPGITKINLTTGPQAISGSTRMQATTIETFVAGNILQAALERSLRKFLSKKEMAKLGFENEISLEQRLKEFSSILSQVKDSLPAIAKFTELEAQTYKTEHFSTYFARRALISVFIDSTERSPTFRLFPLDTVNEAKRRCWIQVWTPAANLHHAWQAFLGRPFRGLNPDFYKKPFEEGIEDAYLKKAALQSLKNAGDDQQYLYDFSFSEPNLKSRGPKKQDLGVAVCISPEEEELRKKNSDFRKFLDLFLKEGANAAIVLISEKPPAQVSKLIRSIPRFESNPGCRFVVVNIKSKNDPFGLDQQIALKIFLNAHSTAVMARLGKVIGNTMTNVSPSNLKLIGRATYLVQSHVNDILGRAEWVKLYGAREPISYGEANAVLFDAISFLKDKQREAGQTAEVALSIIRILESLRLNRGLIQEEALDILKKTGLSGYLSNVISSQSLCSLPAFLGLGMDPRIKNEGSCPPGASDGRFPTASREEPAVRLGNEIFLEELLSEVQGKSLGLIINQTSHLPQGKSLLQALLDKGQKIQAIFSPEHGFFGDVEAGAEVKDNQFKGIKIYSLYGGTRKPTAEQTRDIGAFIYDIQDVGTRFYTYISTLKYMIEAAAEANIPIYILDRPNPLGGEIIEGPLLRPEFSSFLGEVPVTLRYGLTAAELAMMMKGEGWVPEKADIRAVKMKNWKRNFFWQETGLAWIPSSPNIPTPESAIIYPGTALFGAVVLNRGEGTPYPFLQFGAPWLDNASIIKKLDGEKFGIELEALDYTPSSAPGKALHPLYENKICRGIKVSVNKKEKFLSLRFGLEVIKAIKELLPDKAFPESRYLDQMFGNDLLSRYIKGKTIYEEMIAQMEKDEEAFREKRQKYFLYE